MDVIVKKQGAQEAMEIDREWLEVASGRTRADLVLKRARVINVFDGSIELEDVAVFRGRFAGTGHYSARKSIDLKGMYLAPGFIDAHCHIESSMLCPGEFARAVLPHGTTAVVADPHEIANVLGIEGLSMMVEMTEGVPFRFFFTLPSCVPSSDLETSGAQLDASSLEILSHEPWVAGLGEVMNFPGVINGDPEVLRKLKVFNGRPVDGHAPGLSGRQLNAYISSGIGSDHECISTEEALEKLKKGLWIMMRHGGAARNLQDLLPLVNERSARRLMIVTDDRGPEDLVKDGHLDSALNIAIDGGVDPVTAIQMVTINPAQYFGFRDLGAVAPGYRADFVVLSSLRPLEIEAVFVGGKAIFDKEKGLRGFSGGRMDCHQRSIDLPSLNLQALVVPAKAGRLRVVGIVPGQIYTKRLLVKPKAENGVVVPDPSRDILKIVVVERHRGTGSIGVGFVKGLGLRFGAIASTVAHDAHNLIAAGTSDREILNAAQAVARMGGGMAVVRGKRLLAKLPLPIAGLMSNLRVEKVAERHGRLLASAKDLGSALEDPFMALSFLALPVIPELKITDKGLVDVVKFRVVGLFE